MTLILRFWDSTIELVAVIAIVVTAIGLMVGMIEPPQAVKRIILTLGCMVLLLILPPIIVSAWTSLSWGQQIGMILLFTLPTSGILLRRASSGRSHSRKPHT